MRPWFLAPLLLLPLTIGTASRGAKPPAQNKVPGKATVYLFLASDCPIAGRYGPRLTRLLAAYEKRGVNFIGVFPNNRETPESVTGWLKDRKLGRLIPSRNAGLVQKFGATCTPQAVLTDATGKIRYSGRIDDADDSGKVKDPTLALALDAVLAGKKVARAKTVPFGCSLNLTPPAPAGISFATVQPIFEKHCVPCHKKGEVGPMPLDDFKAAVGFAQKIKEQTQSKRMPPWKADSNGEFHDEHKLTEAEIATIGKWAANPSSAPPRPRLIRVPRDRGARKGFGQHACRLPRPAEWRKRRGRGGHE
ncbi:MAG: redoxin family protein [Armatimonas sp.]